MPPEPSTPEKEIISEVGNEPEVEFKSAPIHVVDDVVEYVDTEDKVVDAPNLTESTVDLTSARVVGFNDEEISKTSDDGIMKDDEEILFERKEKSIWKPPDAED